MHLLRVDSGATDTTKTPMSHDTALHRVVRGCVKPLARWGVTPNQITTARLGFGLAAALLYAAGSSAFVWPGSILLLVSICLDRLDGELARATGQSTAWGHRYDLFCDATVNALVFLGIGVGLRHGELGGWAIVLGLVAASAVAAALTLVVRLEAQQGAQAAQVRFLNAVDPDDAMVIAPIAMMLGGATTLLLAAAVLAPLAAFALGVHFKRQSRTGMPRESSGEPSERA